jgi:stage II sporulation protein D
VGYGHGVGMSQWGANYLAKKGGTFDEILKYYYTGVSLETIDLYKSGKQ